MLQKGIELLLNFDYAIYNQVIILKRITIDFNMRV
jgi:hypothetical protein